MGLGSALGSAAGSFLPIPGGSAIGGLLGTGVDWLLGQDAMKEQKRKEEEARKYSESLDANASMAAAMTKPQLKFGGSKDLVEYEGPEHEFGGIKMQDVEVEGDETAYGNYVFSNSLKPSGGSKSFAQLSKEIKTRYFRENDPFTEDAKHRELTRLIEQQEAVRKPSEERGYYDEDVTMEGKKMKCGGYKKYQMGGYIDDPRFRLMPTDATTAGMTTSDPMKGITTMGQFTGATTPPSLPSMQMIQANAKPSIIPAETILQNNANQYGGIGVTDILGGITNPQQGSANGFGINAGLSALPSLIGAATNAYLSTQTDYPLVQARTVDAQLMDATRALQEGNTAFSGARSGISNQGGANSIASLIALAASQANRQSGISADYEQKNRAILGQTDTFNAGQRAKADELNMRQQTASIEDRNAAIAGMGESLQQGASNWITEWSQQKRNAQMLPIAGTQNYQITFDKNGNPVGYVNMTADGKQFVTPINFGNLGTNKTQG